MPSTLRIPNSLGPLKFSHEKPLIWENNRDEWFARIDYAQGLRIPHLQVVSPHKGRCTVVGAGPSLVEQAEAIRGLIDDSNLRVSINGAHNWLIQHDLTPNIHILTEHDLDHAQLSLGGPPHKDVTYYIASISKPEIFEELKDQRRVLFHTFYPPEEYINYIAKKFPGEYCTCAGSTSLFKGLAIAFFLGYRSFDLFGCDGSFLDSSHIDGYITADIEPVIHVYGKNAKGELKRFKTQGGLAYQVQELLEFCDARRQEIEMRVHGDGLLKYVHESRYPEWYQLGE